MSEAYPLRLAVYNDYSFRPQSDGVYAERAFVLFLEAVAASIDRLVLAGQLDPTLTRAYYRVPDSIEFAPLPHYPSLVHPLAAGLAMLRSVSRLWRMLDDVDAVWLLGPHPLCVVLAALAALRGRRVTLGVRQDFPAYARSRHPGRRLVHLAADLLEWTYRQLARRCPTVVVGPELARHYAHARRLLPISVSLVRDGDIVDPEAAVRRRWDGEITVLTVGRLEAEKNPLLLPDVLERLDDAGRWRLVVCGEGPMEEQVRARLRELGVEGRAELQGYLPIDGGLMDLYRASHAFLHVSWTEGVPQVLLEAFASGVPVVATAVGGVPEAVGDAALLVPPGDADAAAQALERIATDGELRQRLIERGAARVRGRTLEAQSRRVAAFLAEPT